MSKRVIALIVVVTMISVFFNTAYLAASGENLEGKVSSVLEKFPAQNSLDRDKLASEIIQLGPKGITLICSKLLPPGTGDDVNVRFALNALTMYASRNGAEAERKMYANTLVKALKAASDKEVKAFFIRQLQLAGKDEAVKALAKYLRDDRLCEPATQALVTIRSKKAEKALLKGLRSARGNNRVTIIKALGELRSKAAVKKIVKYANSSETNLRRVTLFALANIGDPAAEKVLSNVSLTATVYDRLNAPSFLLLYAQRLAESGYELKAAKICRTLVANYSTAYERNIACAALSTLVEALGKGASQDLLAAMDSGNEELVATALQLANTMPDPAMTAKWAKLMTQVIPPRKAQIIYMLGRRGDTSVLPVLISCLKDDDEEVRLAAVTAVTKLGKNKVVPDLLIFLKTAEPEEIAPVQSALLTLDPAVVIPAVAEGLSIMPPMVQVSLLEILATRMAKSYVDSVWNYVESPYDTVRSAAIAALGNLARARDLPRIIELLQQAETEEEINALQTALVVSVMDMDDAEKRIASFSDALTKLNGEKRLSLFEPFIQIGGEKALQVVIKSTENKDPEIRAAAIRTLSNWRDFEAAKYLLDVIKNTDNPEYRTLALRGYFRLARQVNVPEQKQIELFKEVMATCEDAKNKKLILKGLSEISSLDALKFVASFLTDPELQTSAAMAAIRIALPSKGNKNGLRGAEVISILKKVGEVTDKPFARKRVNDYINALLAEDGFVPIFNGKDLSGWKGLVGNPVSRAKMTPEELARAQAKADSIMRAHWKVVNGVLTFDGKGQSLCTAKDYGDFELLVDWKIEKHGDSGIYLRGSPQVQIWDRVEGKKGSGGLYNNKKNPSDPLVNADKPVGEWNTFRIIMIGDRVTVYLNDILVVDNVVLENYWERDKPIYPTGQIELQAHNTPLYFRNIYIREIKNGENFRGLTDEEIQQGYKLLFNGKNMSGWVGDTTGYNAENGKIVLHPEKGSGNLYTKDEFSDFIFRFEFKLTPGANNGLGIRTPLTGNPAYEAMEIQILDNTHPKYKNLKPYQYHGSIYGVVPAKRGFLRPVGEWNEEEVIADGRNITVILNGEKIVDVNLDEAIKNGTMDGRKHPGLKRTTGHIGFLGHGDHVEFRNIRIKELE